MKSYIYFQKGNFRNKCCICLKDFFGDENCTICKTCTEISLNNKNNKKGENYKVEYFQKLEKIIAERKEND